MYMLCTRTRACCRVTLLCNLTIFCIDSMISNVLLNTVCVSIRTLLEPCFSLVASKLAVRERVGVLGNEDSRSECDKRNENVSVSQTCTATTLVHTSDRNAKSLLLVHDQRHRKASRSFVQTKRVRLCVRVCVRVCVCLCFCVCVCVRHRDTNRL